MTDRNSAGHRPRYVQFRFENSLRKYEPAPRKMGRPNQSLCKNCSRNSCDSIRERRLIRLCETRKMYHATSREKASQFIRRKEALVSESASKVSGHVSDFNCSDHIGVSGAAKQDSRWSLAKNALDQIFINEANIIESRPGWEIYVKQTPIKQSLKQELQYQPSPEIALASEPYKVKDIDFHIGLVEELHQKIINEYSKICCSPMQQEQEGIHLNAVEIIPEIRNQISSEELIETNFRNEAMTKFNQVEAQPRKDKLQVNQSSNLHQTNQILIPLSSSAQIKSIQSKKEQFILNSVGRIQIKGDKGQCFLSARILNKYLQSYSSSRVISDQVHRKYPCLGELFTLFQNQSQIE